MSIDGLLRLAGIVKRYGVPRERIVSWGDLSADGFRSISRPVFFLSTGRCGTALLTGILWRDRGLSVHHEPFPELAFQGKRVLECLEGPLDIFNETGRSAWGEVFLAAREEQLLYSFKARKRYVETNNRITFLAPAIAEVLPQAVFVHIRRHPGEFVRSGIRRGWYTGGHAGDAFRPVPAVGTHAERWSGYSDIGKIGWLWDVTNRFVERFKDTVSPERVMTVDFNRLDAALLGDVVAFAGGDVPDTVLRQSLGRKVNRQVGGMFPRYDRWTDRQKKELKDVCGELAEEYGYGL